MIDAEGSLAAVAQCPCGSDHAVLSGSARHWATSPSREVLAHPLLAEADATTTTASYSMADNDLKSLFYARFGELWDAALAEGRLQTAVDVAAAQGVSEADLEQQCVSAAADDVLELPMHLSVTRMDDGPSDPKNPTRYVVNGAYPAQWRRFFEPAADGGDGWWCSASFPHQPATRDTLERLTGAVQRLFASESGVCVLVHPLENLALRVAWMQVDLVCDALAAALLRHGVPLSWLTALLRNPAVHETGRLSTAFERFRGMTAVEVVEAVAAFWKAGQPGVEGELDAVVGETPMLYDYENGALNLLMCSAPDDEVRQHAVVLVHPRLTACSEVRDTLPEQLVQHAARVDAVRRVSAEELRAKLDLHFGPVARYALDQEALRRLAEDDADTATRATALFEDAYGEPWQRVMDEGRIWSVSLAEQLLGYATAHALLKCCLLHGASTTQLSPSLEVTKVTRSALVSLAHPETAASRLLPPAAVPQRSVGDEAHQPYSLVPESFFLVNVAYGLYRHDCLANAQSGEDVAEVWQVSWPLEHETRFDALPLLATAAQADDPTQTQEGSRGDGCAAANEVAHAYLAAVGWDGCERFPLLQVVNDPAGALRARHLWWGTPYDEDAVACQMRSRGESWVDLLAPISASAAFTEAVLVLPSRFSNAKTLAEVCAVLQESDVAVVEECDLYGPAAVNYVFGGNSLLAAANAIACATGETLWNKLSTELRTAVVDTADSIRAAADDFVPAISPDTLVGGATACVALQLTIGDFEAAWHAAQPRRVDRTCWIAFLSQHGVWVMNGHVPLLEQRYGVETNGVHLLRIRWRAASCSWADMQLALVGAGDANGALTATTPAGESSRSPATATGGSLNLLLSRTGAAHSLSETPAATPEPLLLLSPTPYDAMIDVLRWPGRGRSGPAESEVALEDWLLRHPYARNVLSASVAVPLTLLVQQVRETLADVRVVRRPLRPWAAAPQWVALATQSQRDARRHHGFLWLHPSSTTPAVLDALPGLLQEHRVHLRACGAVPLRDAVERQLLDVHHDGFFKNAYVRTAAQVPITDGEAGIFASAFGHSWVTAVQLGLVLNAQEAEQKYGAVHLTTWWDSLPTTHRAKLSEELWIGYMAEEGLYVMNPPYSYRRARLYAGGPEVVWYAVDWAVEDMSWDAFLADVVGDVDPSSAAPHSLRGHFSRHWTQYSLPGKPDQMECVLHASDSPLAALAERCRWLDCLPQYDPYGCVLLRSGVDAALLELLLANPTLYTCATGIMTPAFYALPQEDAHRLRTQLRSYACRSGTLVVPDFVPLVPPPALTSAPTQGDDEVCGSDVALDEARQLGVYRDIALQRAIDTFRLCAFAANFSDTTAPTGDGDALPCTAILYLDPTDATAVESGEAESPASQLPVTHHALRRFVEQHLRSHGLRIVHTRLVRCASEAEAVVLHRGQHHRLYRYGIEVPAWETVAANLDYQARLRQHFEIPFQSPTAVVLRNAAEMADALHASGREVAALWTRARRLYPRDTLVLSDECVVQRLHPRKPFFLLNGDAIEAERLFAARQARTGVHAWYLHWSPTVQPDMSFQRLRRIIDNLQGPRGGLRACWQQHHHSGDGDGPAAMADLSAADSCPRLHVSESILAAVRHREQWWGLPVSTDPVVCDWLAAPSDAAVESAALPPRAITWALQNPMVSTGGGSGEAAFLFDAVAAVEAPSVKARLAAWWAAAQDDAHGGSRNTAVIALMPQAASSYAVHHLVRAVIAEQGLRVEESGFVAHRGRGGKASAPEVVQCLYPEAWSYATLEPQQLSLTLAESDLVAAVFEVSWTALVNSGRVLPAARATKRLRGMSPAQLQLFVKTARRSAWVRPHLHLAELEEYGVVVVNVHVAYLAHTIADTAARHPLPYYVVSWSAGARGWQECVAAVAGDAEPSLAAPQSIRGRVNATWSALGLHAAPTMAESVVCMSEGPVHSLLARLRLCWPAADALDDDLLGGVVVEQVGAAAVPVLRGWLENPMVTCDDRADTVLSHLALWDTEEVLHLLRWLTRTSTNLLPPHLATVRQEGHDEEGKRAAEAAWKTAVLQRNALSALLITAADTDNTAASYDNDEGVLLHRNVGTLLFFGSDVEPGQRAELQRFLEQHGVSVSAAAAEVGEQEVTPELLDRLFPAESRFAHCPDLAGVLRASGEVAAEDEARFGAVFRDEVEWATLLDRTSSHPSPSARGVYSAADAMRLWGVTPHELWAAVQGGQTMRLSEGMEVTRLPCEEAAATPGVPAPWSGSYVINAAFAALRAAAEDAAAVVGEDGEHVGAPPPRLTMWEVAWDSRTLSWQDFVQHVVGYAESDRAVEGTLNALWRKSTAVKEEETGTRCNASLLASWGIVPASGPIAAFAMRMRWCHNADNRYSAYSPDPFVRAMAVAGVVDHAFLSDNWFSDPLVVVSRDATTGSELQRRLFDWTRMCDTPRVLQWLSAFNASGHAADSAHSSTAPGADVSSEAAAEVAEGCGQSATPTAPPPPPRRRKQLRDARAQDALLHARTEPDWRRLWDYYSHLEDPAAGAEPAESVATTAGTIPFASFYRDFKSLDALGVPNMSHELKRLFIEVEVAGRGHMTYAQFTHALLLYQSL